MSADAVACPPGEEPSRVLVVDDHPAVRAGLVALLEVEPGLCLLPPAGGAGEALAAARRGAPDIALLDVSLGDGNGLWLCLELKQLSADLRVLLYTASTDPLLGLKARLVGADALVGKTARANELRGALISLLEGESEPPAFDRDRLRARGAQLSPDGLALIGLRLEATPIDGVAEVLGVPERDVISRIRALLDQLGGDPASA